MLTNTAILIRALCKNRAQPKSRQKGEIFFDDAVMSHRIWFKCIVYLLMYQKNAFLNTCFYFTLQSRLNLDTRYSTGFNSIRTYNLVNCQISEHRFKWYVIDDDRDTSMRWDLVGQTGFRTGFPDKPVLGGRTGPLVLMSWDLGKPVRGPWEGLRHFC